MPVNPIDQTECTDELDIDDVNLLKELLKTENFNINMPINRRRASLFLVACYFCSDKEPLEYLLTQSCEINRTDIFGYNAIMSVILNENMDDETKLAVQQMLITKAVMSKSCSISLFGLVGPFGDVKLVDAIKNGDINKVTNYDYSRKHFILFSRDCVRAYGY